jgi:DNA polymerase-3 subunit alpha
VPVGPGRGSGAGSLVAYALGITDLDPLAYDLLFERFLNPERVSMPDFDIDFCMEGRDRVIEYVAQRYGRDRVSQIATHGSMAAKAVVRDVGRVLGHPYGFVDRIAKLIPFELGITLDKAIEQEAELRRLYENDRGCADPDRSGPQTGRIGAQCRQTRRWRGDRAVLFDRFCAAVLRRGRFQPDHPVRQG